MTALREVATTTLIKAVGCGVVALYAAGVVMSGTPDADDAGPVEQVERDITDAPSR